MKIIGVNVRCGFKMIGAVSIVMMIITALFGFIIGPNMLMSKIASVNLQPGTQKRLMWEKSPIPMMYKVYIFNITNPVEFTQGEKAHLQEIGPYVFLEFKSRTIIADDEDEDSVTFEKVNTFFFRPDFSGGLTGDEIVTIPHMLLMGGLISTQRDKPAFLSTTIKGFTQIFQPKETPLMTGRAMDIMFDGVGIDCNRQEEEASLLCPTIGAKKDIKRLNDTYFAFSLFGGKNATGLGKFKVYRGIKNIMDIGRVITFDDKNESTAFVGECSKIEGTDGTNFAPFHNKKDSFRSYSSIICRPQDFKYKRDSLFNGVPTSVYGVEYDDLKLIPSQHCYCRNGDPQLCVPEGTIDTYPCTGSPSIISNPHFLDADESLLQNVEGLKPDKMLHESYFQFELFTSTAISVHNRIQYSIQIERIEDFDLMANMSPAIVPIFWVEDSLDLPEQATDPMKNGLYFFLKITTIVKYTGIIVGLIGLLIAGYKKYDQTIAQKIIQVRRAANQRT